MKVKVQSARPLKGALVEVSTEDQMAFARLGVNIHKGRPFAYAEVGRADLPGWTGRIANLYINLTGRGPVLSTSIERHN